MFIDTIVTNTTITRQWRRKLTMNEHHPDHPHHGAASSVDRRGFLTAGAKAAAGLAAGGALLGATPGLAAADRARMSSVGILRKPPAQITFAATFNPSELVLWNTLIGQFQAQNPTIKVNLLTITANGGWGQYAEKVISLVAGGRPLDVIRIATEASRLWGAKNLALPLDPFITRDAHHMEDYLNDVSPKLTDVFRYKGQLLGLPFDWNNNIIWYNTAVFKKAGITPPGPNWSADEFVSVAKKVRATGAYGINLWANGTFGIVDWMYAAGGGLYNHDWTKSNATDPANVRAMQFLQDLIWTDKVAPRPGAPDFPLFEAGRVGMINAGRWPLAVFDQAKFYTYDIQYMPRLSPQRKTIFGVGALPIYKMLLANLDRALLACRCHA